MSKRRRQRVLVSGGYIQEGGGNHEYESPVNDSTLKQVESDRRPLTRRQRKAIERAIERKKRESIGRLAR